MLGLWYVSFNFFFNDFTKLLATDADTMTTTTNYHNGNEEGGEDDRA
jgi:hypothetical protein